MAENLNNETNDTQTKEKEKWVAMLLVQLDKTDELVPALAPRGHAIFNLDKVQITDGNGHFFVGAVIAQNFTNIDNDDYKFIQTMYQKDLMKVVNLIYARPMDWSEYE